MSRQSETIDSLFLLDSLEDHCEAVVRCLEDVQRRVCLFSDELNPPLFAQPEFIDAVSKVARLSSQAEIKILVRNGDALIERNHPLLALSRRLPSRIHLHSLSYDTPDRRAFLLADYKSIWLAHDEFLLNEESSGFVNFSAQPEVEHFGTVFKHLWSNSEEEAQLRQLLI